MVEFLIDVFFVFTPAFLAGMIAYSLYSIYQTRKAIKRKPVFLELYLPTHLSFKIKHEVEVDHWLYDKDFGINHELRAIYTVVEKYQDLADTGVCVKVPTVDEVYLVSGKVYVRGKETGKYFY